MSSTFHLKLRAYRDGADAARLRAHNTTQRAHAPVDVVIQDELGHLSGFPTPGLPAHHQNPVGVYEFHQILWTGT